MLTSRPRALYDDALDDVQTRDLNCFVARLHRLQVITVLLNQELPEDILVVVHGDNERAVLNHTGGINHDDTAVVELGRHTVAKHLEREKFVGSTPAATVYVELCHSEIKVSASARSIDLRLQRTI